tara:strand:+ start:117 stop:1091 length:975 start_codon:yes stop_codon:yes gene_type:complete
MSLFVSCTLLVLGFALLTKGADYFIENSASLAEEKGISPHVVGVTIVAFGTSLPELLVSLLSTYRGYSDLALGNIVGSNISNIGLVLALSTFIFHYILRQNINPDKDANNDSYVMLLAVLLLFLFSNDNLISKGEGLFFFILYLFYIFWLFRRSGEETPLIRETDIEEQILAVKMGLTEGKTSYVLLFGGLAGLLLGAQLTVDSAVDIAISIGISEIVVGLSVVAVGTSLPELAGTISAARLGHKEIAVGNVIGSNIANIFLVMGVLAAINPIEVETNVVQSTLPLLILLTIATFGIIRIPMTRLSGLILFAFFALFVYELTLI